MASSPSLKIRLSISRPHPTNPGREFQVSAVRRNRAGSVRSARAMLGAVIERRCRAVIARAARRTASATVSGSALRIMCGRLRASTSSWTRTRASGNRLLKARVQSARLPPVRRPQGPAERSKPAPPGPYRRRPLQKAPLRYRAGMGLLARTVSLTEARRSTR